MMIYSTGIMKSNHPLPPATKTTPPVWEYAISDEQFGAVLQDKDNQTQFSQAWAVSRLIQHRSFYEVIATIPSEKLRKLWPQVKPTIHSESIKKGYEYYLHKTLPAAN